MDGANVGNLGLGMSTPPISATSHRRRLTREDQALLSKQTYAPASLLRNPMLLRAYMLLFGEFGSRPSTAPMSEIAAALGVTERCARERIAALEAARVLEVERRPGQESEYRLLQEDQYIEMPLSIVLHGNHAACAVWGTQPPDPNPEHHIMGR